MPISSVTNNSWRIKMLKKCSSLATTSLPLPTISTFFLRLKFDSTRNDFDKGILQNSIISINFGLLCGIYINIFIWPDRITKVFTFGRTRHDGISKKYTQHITFITRYGKGACSSSEFCSNRLRLSFLFTNKASYYEFHKYEYS